jgi:hypothetical protein
MSYQVKFTETTNPAKPSLTVADQSLNQETSLVFPGKNYAGYAPVIAENFLHLLENFARNTAPSNPVQGQLWYDNSAGVNLLKVFDGTSWTPAGTVKKADSVPSVASSLNGDLWVDTANQQLYVYSGSNWLLIGPQYSSGLRTGPDVETITDTSNIDHSVITMYSENSRIAIISKAAFTPKTTLLGFASIGQGLNLSTIDATSTTTPTKIWGTAEKADALVVNGNVVSASSFLRKDEASTTNFPLNVRNSGGIGIGSDLSFSITTDESSTSLSSKTSGNYIRFKLNNAGTTVTGLHLDATGSVDIFATGFAIPTLLGNVTLVTNNFINVTGVTAIAVLGNTTETSGGAVVDLTGVYSVGRIGTVIVKADSINNVLGVKAVVRLNTVNVWGLINTDQTANWANINTTQTPNWTNVLVPQGVDG